MAKFIPAIRQWLAMGFPGGSEVKASACNAGDLGSIPGSGRSPGEGDGNPLQYSRLENPMDRGAGGLQSTGSQSWTRLSDFTFPFSHGFLRLGATTAFPFETQESPLWLVGEGLGETQKS